ncbi:MAG: HAD family hydrolase [Kiloniellales bacterium]
MAIEGILFDKDGTLLDYHETWMPVNRRAALAAAGGDEALAGDLLALAGYDHASSRVRSNSPLAAWSNDAIAALWAGRAPGWEEGALTRVIEDIFLQASAAPVTDLAALFLRLKGRGLALGLATHDSAAGAEATVTRFGLGGLLDFVAGYDSGHGTKPGPGMVEGFCRATGLAPGAIAVVGDNLHDLEMGRAAGVALVVGVLTGTSHAADLAPLADRVLDDITQLEVLLDSLA